jgi:serine/threonine protein kinase
LLRVIDHPSVVKVYRFFERNGTAYLVMPFYKGQTLKKALQIKNQTVDESSLKALLKPTVDALENIHQ